MCRPKPGVCSRSISPSCWKSGPGTVATELGAQRRDWFRVANGRLGPAPTEPSPASSLVLRYAGLWRDPGRSASHQIDQFLHFTGAEDARCIVTSRVGNLCHPDDPGAGRFWRACRRRGSQRLHPGGLVYASPAPSPRCEHGPGCVPDATDRAHQPPRPRLRLSPQRPPACR